MSDDSYQRAFELMKKMISKFFDAQFSMTQLN